MKITSYNVNGIRAAIKKGLIEWLSAVDADVVCFQEIKANKDQVELKLFEDLGYSSYWMPAQKKGYSGVAILSKLTPLHIEYGCGNNLYDCEGRVLRVDFSGVSIINVYMPSGTTGQIRQSFKYMWLNDFLLYIKKVKNEKPNLVVCGDFNICHSAIDIHNPVSNKNSSGFLPEERQWMTKYLEDGFIDTFRFFNQQPHHYTWWSNRPGVRQRNLGWRIDYFMASLPLKENLKRSVILKEACHSDHCPVLLEVDLENSTI